MPTGEPPCHRHSRRHLSSHHGSKRMRIRLLLGIPIVCGQHAQPRLGPGATWQHFARIRSVLPFESARRGPWAASRTCEHRRAPSVDGGKRAVTPAVRCVGCASFAAAAPWLPACPAVDGFGVSLGAGAAALLKPPCWQHSGRCLSARMHYRACMQILRWGDHTTNHFENGNSRGDLQSGQSRACGRPGCMTRTLGSTPNLRSSASIAG